MKKLIQVTALSAALVGSLFTGTLTTDAATTSQLTQEAKSYLGTPYRSAGTTTAGFDCSGYTQYVFKQLGISIPRDSRSQWAAGTTVSKANLQVGDLVFFNSSGSGISHVGIYIGNGNMIGSASSTGVAIVSINDPYYWGPRYIGAKRIANFDSAQAQTVTAAATAAVEYSTRAEIAVAIADDLELQNSGSAAGFSDVNASASYADAVYALQERGIVAGNGGKFNPSEKVKRSEMAKMLDKAYGLSDLGGSISFSDVPSPSWMEDHIDRLAQHGITRGMGDGTFGVDGHVKTTELKLFMERAGN